MFKPLRKDQRLLEEVADQIRESIFRGDFVTGDRLPSEQALCGCFKVGRGTVREALRLIERAGLIQMRRGPRGGAFVSELNIQTVKSYFSEMLRLGKINFEQLAEARLALENLILDQAMKHWDEKSQKRIKENIATTESMIAKGEYNPSIALQFHILMAEATKNPVFIVMAGSVLELLHLFLQEMRAHVDMAPLVIKRHKKIYEWLIRGNAAAAQKEMSAHIDEILHGYEPEG